MNAMIQAARNAGPYVAIELLLPGGSVVALLLWLFRSGYLRLPVRKSSPSTSPTT